MNLQSFTDGLDILKVYYNDPTGYHLAADHDQIFLYPTDRPVVEADVERLSNLGWFQAETSGDLPESYDSAEGWSCFV